MRDDCKRAPARDFTRENGLLSARRARGLRDNFDARLIALQRVLGHVTPLGPECQLARRKSLMMGKGPRRREAPIHGSAGEVTRPGRTRMMAGDGADPRFGVRPILLAPSRATQNFRDEASCGETTIGTRIRTTRSNSTNPAIVCRRCQENGCHRGYIPSESKPACG